ncbi:hypothetical protein LX59_02481 [Azomonas agilis]|uniref:Uncharacterized protein n=2 Tax=Azomonas agilis TaxID=116849 RepID=A0A562I1H7_9GAMM|nr:hypothetical protein LX59_02481 [Azomonas agilis]
MNYLAWVKKGLFLGLVLLTQVCAVVWAAEEPSPTLEELLKQQGYQKGESVNFIQRHNMNRWEYLDNSHIILDGGPGPQRLYLVEFIRPCRQLRFKDDLSYKDTLEMGYLHIHDRILATGGGSSEYCQVQAMFRLSPLQPPSDSSSAKP